MIFPTMVRKLQGWDITPRAKRVGLVIAELSLAVDAWDVELSQREICTLAALSEPCVSKAVNELLDAGVLQRKGRRGDGPRVYRLLPNAELVEPTSRLDEDAVRGVRAAVLERQRRRCAGDDSRGQIVLLRTDEEVVADRLATGSVERAMEDLGQWEPGRLSAAVRASLEGRGELACGASPPGNLPGGQVGELAWEASRPADTAARACVRVRTLNVYTPSTTNVERSDVGCGQRGNGAAVAADVSEGVFAFELVRDVLTRTGNEEDFRQWEPKWRQRCGLRPSRDPELKPQPKLIALEAGAVKADLLTGRKVNNPGGAIVAGVRRALGALAHTFKMLMA